MLQARLRDAHLQQQCKEEQVVAWAGQEPTTKHRATGAASFLAPGSFGWKGGGLLA